MAELVDAGQQLVLVHGGSHLTNQVATALGHPPQFVTSPSGYSSRVTDRAALEIFEMVYCGQVNKNIVERLQRSGVNAIGLSGIDGRLWEGSRKKAIRVLENGRIRIIRNNYTGRVEKVNTELLYIARCRHGSRAYATGHQLRRRSDQCRWRSCRAATAAALGAADLIILSNIPGVLRDFPDESSLIPLLDRADIDSCRKTVADGRMRIKLLGAQEALDGGVCALSWAMPE